MRWYVPSTPSADLAEHLVCVWSAVSDGQSHLLVPDGCVDVLWIAGVGIRVCGPETSAWSFTLPPGVVSAGVRFRPGLASFALRASAAQLRDTRVGLDDLIGSAGARPLADRLDNARTAPERLEVFQSAVRRWLAHGLAPDPLIGHLRQALSGHSWSVGTLADTAALTERQLQRRCNEAFGYGPATLRSILRLQRFMALADAGPGRGLAELAAVAGYSDQSHLNREARRISTLTPTALLAGEAPRWHGPGSALDVRSIQSLGDLGAEESAA
ncbi:MULTISPECIES: helix-turn-helix domain-containing protein [Rhodococcus]|uniref:helix-turn-helix domain-containing protein n=1 Tax=Rhodococcus TaxID=1827 RepID=UPI00160AA5E3|nr:MULTISPECIES: helix-turn-helix domain-containing protein [Rhodococcus]MBC2592287.1 AraC family transcriptional regulator [Rhodococcus aetherivorans]